MNSFSALQHALAGIQADAADSSRARRRLRSAEPADLAEPWVDTMQHQRALEVSANVMRRVDDTLGMFLGTFA